MMIVFAGPTLSAEEVRRECEAICLPPVSQGDVYRAVQQRPGAIGIIDGYFSGAPSVWHKEILYALSRGIPVYGSASMGALRAAELAGFGMHGVGRIFEAYRDGLIEDDDEVAVIHGPPDMGYPAISEAMVNIRATLARAEIEGVLGAAPRATLEHCAKALFYHRREWQNVIEGGLAQGVAPSEIEALRAFLPQGRVDQKREDALAMLAAMREADARSAAPTEAFRFEWTQFWDELVAREGSGTSPAGTSATGEDVPVDGAVLDELRLGDAATFTTIKMRAVLRLAGEARRARESRAIDGETLRGELARLRLELSLFTRAELDAWLGRNGLDEASLANMLAGRHDIEAMLEGRGAALDAAMLDELRLRDTYEGLAARARDKMVALRDADAAGMGRPGDGAAALAARLRFLEERAGERRGADIGAIMQEFGFRDLAHFDDVLRREEIYKRLQRPRPDRYWGDPI